MVSVYPCEIHGSRIRGALEGIRITLLRGDDRYSRRLRVCPSDLTELLRTHSEEWIRVDDDGLATLDGLCTSCGTDENATRFSDQVFVYVWRRGQPQDEFYGALCYSCGERLRKDFALVKEEHRL